jgi:programmed cell death protein 5
MYYGKPENEKEKEEEAARKAEILRRALTIEARQRLRNVSLVRPELAKNVENIIINLYLSGKITEPIDDSSLKQILLQLTKKRDFRIRGL